MIINKTIFTLGYKGDPQQLKEQIANNANIWEYFIYTTETNRLNIGLLSALKREKSRPVILGVASTKAQAEALAVHIVKKALTLGETIEEGICNLTK